MPETVITSNISKFKNARGHSTVVVKPLYLKGGEGITKLKHCSLKMLNF